MAVAVTHLTSSGDGTNNQDTYTTASITPTADRLVLAWVAYARSSGAPSNPSVSGNGLTWEVVNGVTLSSTRLILYRTMGAAPSAGVVTINPADTNVTRVLWSISEFSDVDTSGTNGSGAVVQSDTEQVNATSITSTLAAFGSTANATVGGFIATANGRTWTEGSGFTAIAGGAHDLASESISIFTQFRADNDTTVDASISGGGIQLFAVSAEIKAAAAAANDRALMYARRRGR